MHDSDTFHAALSLLSHWYASEIHALADAAIESIHGRIIGLDEGHPEVLGHLVGVECPRDKNRREWLEEWVDNATDGHEFVIYTAQAQAVLLATDSDGAYEEETGGKPPSPEIAALYAMRADLWSSLNARKDEWEWTADELRNVADIEVRCEPEVERIEGNASSIDEETDRETEAWIHEELESGNEWAWCNVLVTAAHAGEDGADSLGCCSYKSEADFRAGPYYGDLVDRALQELAQKLNRDYE